MTCRQNKNQRIGGIAAQARSKKFRAQKIRWKFLASIFWDRIGILLIDYFPKGQTVNAEYFLCLLVQLEDILKENAA